MTDSAVNQETDYNEPTWLDSAYVKKILQHHTNNDLVILKNYKISAATEKGENYASTMNLLNAEYIIDADKETIENISLIVKSRLDNELMSQIEEDFNVFHREAQVYTTILDKTKALMQSIGEDIDFGPKAVYVDDRCIVQENLKLKDFYIADVKRGFNFEQCSMILIKLAKFHATSMVLYKKNPDMFRHHLPGNVSENPSPLHDLYKNAIQTCIEYCRNCTKLHQYVAPLMTFADKIIPKMINVFSRNQADRYHVLNHGDMWVNNIMFHGKDGEEDNVLFVDYQEGFYGSAGIDWNFFIFTSWQSDVFQHRFEELMEIYHKELVDVLQKLHYEQRIPTLEDVRKEIINKGYHGLTTATCLLPILINEHKHLADPLNFLLDTDEAMQKRRTVFNNPNFGKRLEIFLAFFAKNGIL